MKEKKSVDFTHLADPSLHTGLSSKHGLVKVFTLLILSCSITHRSFCLAEFEVVVLIVRYLNCKHSRGLQFINPSCKVNKIPSTISGD